MRYNFKTTNPIVSFFYIVLAVTITFSCQNPIISALSLISAIITYILLRYSLNMLKFIGFGAIIIALANFILTSEGDTVLFSLLNKNFTIEALLFGISSGLMFFASIVWFMIFSKVFSSEKLLYILSPLTPTIAIVLTLILRLVPLMIKRLGDITQTQKTLQINGDEGTAKKRILKRFEILSSLLMMSVEDCFDLSLSMTARGYGTTHFTSAKRYRFKPIDFIFSMAIIITFIFYMIAVFLGDIKFLFYPKISFTPFSVISALGYLGSAIFFTTSILGRRCMFE